MQTDMSEDEALQLAESEFWKDMTPKGIALFQLVEDRLCMPLRVFQDALEEVLGRGVVTHEMAHAQNRLLKEVIGEVGPPSSEEVLDMIPE